MSNKKDLLSVTDLSPPETLQIVRRARQMKAEGSGNTLTGKNFALLFEKPSLRTRTSFQVGIQQLGGYSVYLGQEEAGLGTREPAADVARVLSGYVDCIIARVHSHHQLVELARHATVPVVNALSDWEHPCQILADLLTLEEHWAGLDHRTLAYIGDGNNVARSLCLALPPFGISVSFATPNGYNLDSNSLKLARRRAGPTVEVLSVADPSEAVKDADAVYTDVWASMGQEMEADLRRQAFKGYTVDPALMSQARPGALFMHDMPAHYGEEVPPGMLEHPQSVAFEQAHNRLHAHKAILEFVLNAG